MRKFLKYFVTILAFVLMSASYPSDNSFKIGLGLGILGVGTHAYCSFYKKKVKQAEHYSSIKVGEFEKLYIDIERQKQNLRTAILQEKVRLNNYGEWLRMFGNIPDESSLALALILANSTDNIQNFKTTLNNLERVSNDPRSNFAKTNEQVINATDQLSQSKKTYSRLYYGAFLAEIIGGYLIWKSIAK